MLKPKFILAAILLSGSSQVLTAPAPVSELSTVGSSPQSDFETRLTALESMVKSRNMQFIQLQQQLEQLQDEVSQLRGVTEEQNYKLEKVLQRQRELYQEIEQRVSSVYQAPATPSVATDASATGSVISGNLSENDAYDKAVQLVLRDKRYDQAIPEFNAFLTNYPESMYVPNAHYWLGQLLTIKNENAGAQGHFEAIVNGYPDSSKRADAMLKLGTLYAKGGDKAKAKKVLEDLIAQYPDSTSSKLAVDKLAGL
jgi:tol-pal system protein YbgF